MSKKYSTWASIPRSSSMKIDVTVKKLTTVKGDEQDQCKYRFIRRKRFSIIRDFFS